MKVELYNQHTKVVDANIEEDAFLLMTLQYVERNDMFRFSKELGKTERVTASPIRYLYNQKDYTFAGGLTSYVRRMALKRGLTFEYLDKRVKPCEPIDPGSALDFIDRSFIREGVDIAASRTRGIVSLPTGTGKGHLAVGLGIMVPTTWMFLTPNKDTYINLVARFEKHCAEPVGRIGKGKIDIKRITIAMMQTVQRRLEDQDKEVWEAVRNTKAICIDEAHTVAAPGRLRVAMSFQNAYWRIGLSATALERPDGRNLITMGATGDVIYWKTIQDEEVKKSLARGKVRMIGCKQHGVAKTYLGAYHELVTGSEFRNLMLTAIARVAAKPALLLVREKSHGENLVKSLTRANLRVKYITGDADEDERFATLQTIEDNEVDVVVATIFHMAVDIPNLRAVINGAAGDSPISTVQRAGRGSRGREGKETFEVWDVFDQGTGSATWLVRHARKRRKVYEDEGYDVEVVKELLPLAF